MSDHPDTNNTNAPSASIRGMNVLRMTAGSPPEREHCRVIVEEFLTIMVEDVGTYTVMCTPCDLPALAVGFLFSEGIIATVDDISLLSHCDDDPSVIRVRLTNPPAEPDSGRTLIVATSCGMCGTRNIEEILAGLRPVGNSLRITHDFLAMIADKTHSRQVTFAQTGSAHAAGIFTANGNIVAFAEDIGRHNALDKAIGKCVLQERSADGCGVFLTGRVSSELAIKAANAGIELIAAVSAPSSMAVDVAQRCNITLCGFVRGDRATVYAHPERIADLPSPGDGPRSRRKPRLA